MKNPALAALATRLAFACCLTALAGNAPAGEAGPWVDLLAGGSLDAWRGYQQEEPPASWGVDADGVLTLDGEGADLITRETYGDFELSFDWRIAEGGNSGVMYRVTEENPESYETGPEYQVLDDPAYAGSDADQLSGAIYALYARTAGGPRPAGEWNQARIVIDNGRLEHWLNGEKVAEAQLGSDEWDARVAGSKFSGWKRFGKNASGHLALQNHGAVVSYRNMKVRRLNAEKAAAPGDVSGATRRVLFVTQSAGFVHSTVNRQEHEVSHSERVLKELGVRSGAFRVDCTQDVATDFTPELLENYDAVAFYTTGALPIPEETLGWFLDTWLAEEGHGFLGVHAAADTYHDHQPYWDMIGGTFDGHPWTSNTDVVLKVHDGDHPASSPWGPAGARIPITDEIYQFKNWQPEKVRVLMSLDMRRTELKRPRHVPVLWVKPFGAGRVMHMSLGHREDVWENPMYQESLINGLKWLMGDLSGDATPNPELSAAEQADAEAAAAAPVAG